jgi:hypothetical protein
MELDDSPAGRPIEVLGGLFVLAAAIGFGFFGAKGGIAYIHGSREAPADPLACTIGIIVGLIGGFLAVRLIAGWREERPLLPQTFLLPCSLACLGMGVYTLVLERQLGRPMTGALYELLGFGSIGVAGLGLWWHRRARQRKGGDAA